MATESRSKVDAAVDGFLAHAAVERGLAPRTLEAYGRDLARFSTIKSQDCLGISIS